MLFVNHYINEYNFMYSKNVQGITRILENFFLNYYWEGNVRELKHIMESMVSLSDTDILEVQHLPAYMYDRIFNESITESNNAEIKHERNFNFEDYNLNKALEEKERELITEVLKITKGNKTKAGELLGIPRQTLKYKIDKLNI